jgi:uncharacterized protein (TIGR02099 family)
MDDLTPTPSPLLKACAFIARWSLGLFLLGWLLFAAGWGALHLLIVPRIGELRPQLEAVASRTLGVTVRIEAISAYSTGMIPAFELVNVRLLDAQGREALRLPRVLFSLSPRSMLSLQFDQLYVDRPTLSVRRTVDGRFFVAGLDVSQGQEADARLLDQVFSQPEFVIRQGAVLWTDELRAVPTLALRDVDLVLRNGARRHDLRLDATPSADWGDRFGIVARFEQPFLSMDNGRWREWSGQAFAMFTRVDVSQLKRYADLGVDIQQGRGALRAWVDVRRAKLTAATADLALADVATRLDPALQPLELVTLSGRLGAKWTAGSFELSTEGLAFDTAEGLHWPGGNVLVNQTDANAARPAHGEIIADRLDLATLTQIASRLPLGAPIHAALAHHAPRGLVERLKAKWQGPLDAIDQYQVQGSVQQLELLAVPAEAAGSDPVVGTPGIRGAHLEFDLNEASGHASLVVQDGAVTLPGVFEEPVVPFTQLAADIAWQRDKGKVMVQIPKLRFSNPDAEGELQLKWQTGDPERAQGRARYPGLLDLQGSLSRGAGPRVYRYLPLVLHKEVRDYVRDAVLAGSSSKVRFKVKGDLRDMPFADPKQGEFSIVADIKDGVLAYVPRVYQGADALPWPVLSQVAGELAFERKSLQVRGARASLQAAPAVQLSRAEVQIIDLTQPAVLLVAFDARSALPDLLSVVNGSPLGALSGNALARASATGMADLRLKMVVPVHALEKSTVQGSLALAGNDLQFAPDVPRLSRARGIVGFTESGFTLAAVQARMLGGDVRLDGGTLPVAAAATNGALRFAPSMAVRIQGVVSAEGLRQARELGLVSRLAQRATGSTSYVANVTLRASVPEISVSSNLSGLALDLPPPLSKVADATLPLRLESALVRESTAPGPGGRSRLQDQLVADFGRIGSVTYVRDLSGAEPRVLRGAIAIGLTADEVAPLPAEGVVANINLGIVDIDAWGAVLAEASGASLADLDPGVASGGQNIVARSYLPTVVAVRARELHVAGRRLHQVVLGGAREGQLWRANLDAEELNGYVEFRQPVGPGAGRVFARLSRLTLASASTKDVETLLDDQPASIPALDIVVEDFELRGKRLGRVEIDAINRLVVARDGGVREWRLNKFDIFLPEAVLRASGNWAAINAQGGAGASTTTVLPEARRTVMNFHLDIVNSGELLARFGMKDVVRRGKGVMEGQVAWVGSPLTLDYATLGGAFNVNLESGQFLKADPGLAKLLGVLSLQSLPRRLALDFRDVFSDGFAFDFVRGDVRIERGIASSNNLQMKGINAAVLMDGKADLFRETQDIRVVVVPEVNAGTASLIATAINPAIGLGSFLAQLFLRRPLMEAATQEFHIDGSWVDPRISKLARKAVPGPADPADNKSGETP